PVSLVRDAARVPTPSGGGTESAPSAATRKSGSDRALAHRLAGAPRWRLWLLAARPATLPAAVVPVLVGTAAALPEAGVLPRPLAFLAALLCSLLIQVGTNFANDYFDFRKGADTAERLGPTRVTQAGLIAPGQVLAATVVAFGLAALVGV